MDNLYKENILDHYNNPRNKRVLESPSIFGREYNALCGDDIMVYAQANDEGIIQELTFVGEGCAISQAAASLFTEYVKGKRVDETVKMGREDVEALLGIPLSTVRARCALLPVQALRNGLCNKI